MIETISYDPSSFIINGKREFLLTAVIHYWRCRPEEWDLLFKQAKKAHINCIQTYVFWGVHEPEQGVYNFDGRYDLLAFCRKVKEHGLYLILRIGPYACAEINYGGFPYWLRNVPGIQFRTYNEPFMAHMEKWIRYLSDKLEAVLPRNGGPLILAEIENEYNGILPIYKEDGHKYVDWAEDLAESLSWGVPWIGCLRDKKSINTIHGFEGSKNIDEFHKENPTIPALWTESWTGWYKTFGSPYFARPAHKLASEVLRFFAKGGAGVSYFPWFAGTNWGRDGMYLGAPDYAMDAPINTKREMTPKAQLLGRVHALLKANTLLLTTAELTCAGTDENLEVITYASAGKTLCFISNRSPSSVDTEYGALAPEGVIVVENGDVVMNCSDEVVESNRRSVRYTRQDVSLEWECALEPLPGHRPEQLFSTQYQQPQEQLALTEDKTDYCWYSTSFDHGVAVGPGHLTLSRIADSALVFLNGELVARTETPIEDRGPTDSNAFLQQFRCTVGCGGTQYADGKGKQNRLDILCSAMGLIKHDTMIGFENMVNEKKGLWGPAYWKGVELPGPWEISPFLVGERYPDELTWQPGCTDQSRPCWWRTRFTADQLKDRQKRFLSVNLGSMHKGLVFLNGHFIARYWQIESLPGAFPYVAPSVDIEGIGESIQEHYLLPYDLIQEENELLLFDEAGVSPTRVELEY